MRKVTRFAVKSIDPIFGYVVLVVDFRFASGVATVSTWLNCWKKTRVLRQLVCLLIESDAVTSSAVYGSVYGLVVITAERYVKIVHPVAHRNHYRRWMTVVGVATPWLIGLLTSFVPSLTTTEFVDGTCRTLVCHGTLVNIYCRLHATFDHLNTLGTPLSQGHAHQLSITRTGGMKFLKFQ